MYAASMIVCFVALAACGTNVAPSADQATNAVAAVVTPAPPTTTPPSAPTPAGAVVAAASLAGEVAIADNFDVSQWLEPGEGPHASPDEVGAFRFTCLAGQLSHDDPIVYPGQPGKSHLHQFFGNTGTNASSNYQSLRTTGGSTCTRSTGTSPQRSAYWMPAMMDGAGNVVKPDWINTYYKRIPASDPKCQRTVDPNSPTVAGPNVGQCIEMPNGLRFILGYNMATGLGGPLSADQNANSDFWAMGFDCVTHDIGNQVSYTGTQHSIAAIVASGKCPVGAWLRAFVRFPICWDGKNLDTADHRSHIVYGFNLGCPTDHPYEVPEIAIQSYYTVDEHLATWHLSSDEMLSNGVAGQTLHMDYWEAWSPALKDLWNANCIDGHLTCSSGNLGDGRKIKGMDISFANHELIPLTSIP